MTDDLVTHLTIDALVLAFKLAMPFLATSLLVGIVVSVVQAATQIQELTLTFIPKIVITGVVMLVAGPWMLQQISAYTTELFGSIPGLAGP